MQPTELYSEAELSEMASDYRDDAHEDFLAACIENPTKAAREAFFERLIDDGCTVHVLSTVNRLIP